MNSEWLQYEQDDKVLHFPVNINITTPLREGK